MREISLAKLVDEIIFPFVLLVAARYFGVFVSTFILPIQFTFDLKLDFAPLPFLSFTSLNDLETANSVSWVFTGAVLAVIFGFVAFRTLHLHEDHLHPKEAARLHQKKIAPLIINSREAFHQALSWSAVAAISLASSTADFILGNVSTICFGVVAAISATILLLFAVTIGGDLSLERKKV